MALAGQPIPTGTPTLPPGGANTCMSNHCNAVQTTTTPPPATVRRAEQLIDAAVLRDILQYHIDQTQYGMPMPSRNQPLAEVDIGEITKDDAKAPRPISSTRIRLNPDGTESVCKTDESGRTTCGKD